MENNILILRKTLEQLSSKILNKEYSNIDEYKNIMEQIHDLNEKVYKVENLLMDKKQRKKNTNAQENLHKKWESFSKKINKE